MTLGSHSRRLAAVPVAAALLAIGLTGCAGLLSPADPPPATDSTTGAEIEQKNADVFQLEVGQCLNDGEETGLVDDVPTVDCASEHDSEVYFVFDLDDGDYPGATEVDDAADAGCLGAFTDYVGLDFDSSKYSYSSYTPTTTSWAAGDHEVACVLIDPEGGKLTGTLKGIAQ